MTLIERIESADRPDRELLAEAHLALNPEPVGEQGPIQTDNWRAWSNGSYKFGQLLAAGAFLDAALTLVPDPKSWSVGQHGDAEAGSSVFLPGGSMFHASASTPALALCAAALKARNIT